jgi:hypothetical protein
MSSPSARLVGHSSVSTTQRYIEVNDEVLRRAVETPRPTWTASPALVLSGLAIWFLVNLRRRCKTRRRFRRTDRGGSIDTA